MNKSLATGLDVLFILFFCNFPSKFWLFDIFLFFPSCPGLPTLEMISKTPGCPDHAPPRGANGASFFLFKGVRDHSFAAHLLPYSPTASIEEAASVLWSSWFSAKPRNFGRQSVIQLPRNRSADDGNCHQSIPKSIYGIMSIPKSIYGITETTDREPRALDLLVMAMVLLYKFISCPDSDWYYF